MAKRKSKDIYLMPEPKWQEINALKTDEEKKALYRKFEYFVHYEVPDKKAVATVKTWLDKESGLDKELIKKLKKVPDVWFGTFAKHTFIWSKTGYMHDDVKNHLISKIPALENKAEEIIEKQEEKKAEKPKISLQQRMKEQVEALCAEWEGYVDELMCGNGFDVKKFDPYNEMRSYAGGIVKPNHAKIIKDEYVFALEEAKELLDWQDPDIKEAYSYTDAKLRKAYLAFYEKIISACETMISTGKAQRKTRKPKAVSKERLVSKLKFQINDSELGLASINPIEIIDATEVWVYNTKTRKLGIYKVGGLSAGMTVKGTSIQDFDSAKSVQKTLRKPAEQLKLFKGNAKTKWQKAFADIKTTDTKLNGRFNDTTIILKAF
jgi:hypothetical protein